MARSVRSIATHRALAAVLAVLALSVPTVAHSISLAQLLQLPLEQLLRLKITTAAPAGGAPHGR